MADPCSARYVHLPGLRDPVGGAVVSQGGGAHQVIVHRGVRGPVRPQLFSNRVGPSTSDGLWGCHPSFLGRRLP
jgi:hypothetical protein